MNKQVHLLNGDSLKKCFPNELFGSKIVFRECLIDGDLSGDNFEKFFQNRANYIYSIIESDNKINYPDYTLKEFNKINKFKDKADINLWFEEDLFCQANLWFILFYLMENNFQNNIFLIRPNATSPFSFGNLSKDELLICYNKKVKINTKSHHYFCDLWKSYQQKDFKNMVLIANKLNKFSSFLIPVIKAHIERFDEIIKLGRPKQTLLNIKKQFNTSDFSFIFKEFTNREAIYGFGDLQVRLMLNELEKYKCKKY